MMRLFTLLLFACNLLPYLFIYCNSSTMAHEMSISDVFFHWVFKDKCMGELGCFNSGPPFFDISERPLSLVPSNRDDINTRFYLFTRRNPNTPSEFSNLNATARLLWESNFDPRRETKLIVPGFISSMRHEWEFSLKDALLAQDNLNVFMVDWTGGDGPLYEQAVANARVVGAEVAAFVKFLMNVSRANPESFHIIGHSLGSHIAGYAGKQVSKLGRITGLDPAGPYFEHVDPVVRLDRTDALFVDNIHTNSATNRFNGFGTPENIGDLDFYPNGGMSQPGCPDIGPAIWSFFKHPTLYVEAMYDVMCNHHRSVELFIASVSANNSQLVGLICDSWENFENGRCGNCTPYSNKCVIMGYRADSSSSLSSRNGSSKVYLRTGSEEPFEVPLTIDQDSREEMKRSP